MSFKHYQKTKRAERMLLNIDSRLEFIGFLNLFSKVTAMRSNNFFWKCDAFVSLSFCVKLGSWRKRACHLAICQFRWFQHHILSKVINISPFLQFPGTTIRLRKLVGNVNCCSQFAIQIFSKPTIASIDVNTTYIIVHVFLEIKLMFSIVRKMYFALQIHCPVDE